MRHIGLIGLSFLLALFLLSCGGGTDEQEDVQDIAEATPTPKGSSLPSENNISMKIGKTYIVKDGDSVIYNQQIEESELNCTINFETNKTTVVLLNGEGWIRNK